MFVIILTTLACLLTLNHLSKLLSTYLSKANDTTPASNMPKPQTIDRDLTHHFQSNQALTFSTLPPELRLQIYTHILPVSHPYIIGRDYGHSTSRLRFPALCQTSRRLRAETLPMFLRANTFIVDVHVLKDLKQFLKWLQVLTLGTEVEGDVLGSVRDLRVTVGGCLLVDVVPKAGRRRYGDARVVAAKPMLNNSLKWDRKNILHYVKDPVDTKPSIETLLADVQANATGDSGLRVTHLIELVKLVFKIDRFDSATKKVFQALEESR